MVTLKPTPKPTPIDTNAWEGMARQFFEKEWARFQAGAHRSPSIVEADCEHGTARMLLPWLVQLLAEEHEQPAQALEPAIRRLVAEQSFVEESGDPVTEGRREEVVDLYVAVFVRVLEGVRQRALETGTWSRMPPSPQMFG